MYIQDEGINDEDSNNKKIDIYQILNVKKVLNIDVDQHRNPYRQDPVELRLILIHQRKVDVLILET